MPWIVLDFSRDKFAEVFDSIGILENLLGIREYEISIELGNKIKVWSLTEKSLK